jgi:hypothetical protein
MMPSNVSSHEPFSDFMYPLIESMDSDPFWLVQQQQQQQFATEDDPVRNSTTTSNGNVVGTIATTIYWRELIKNNVVEVLWSCLKMPVSHLLPIRYCKFNVNAGHSVCFFFTNQYRSISHFRCPFIPIKSGRSTTYLGKNDHHDTKYDRYKKSHSINEVVAGYNGRYSGVSLDEELCPFTMQIYPSEIYYSNYTSHDPIRFAFSVVGIFLFVTFVLFLYDQHVEKRQRYVLRSATRSSAIVSSLFPSAVRSQMLERYEIPNNNNNNMNHRRNSNNSSTNTSVTKLAQPYDFIGHAGSMEAYDLNRSTTANASLYPNTTIFFADLAGFTAWSR